MKCLKCLANAVKGFTMKYLKRIVTILVGISLLSYCYYPVKVAVKKDSDITGEYIICEPCKVTGFEWEVMESSNGYEGYVFIKGDLSDFQSKIKEDSAIHNSFILYGEFVQSQEFEGIVYPVFNAVKWDVIYPVKRNSSFEWLSPKYGFTKSDFC